ncbi:MADS-box transcription factor 29-like [Prunus yedoensis var. nudiflora]|uniref:MADS-box transcription factor 29-like n=1 Tax=Prunus yedoensis var. nudiflora TaxID=2094558 RepID=A0A314XKQ6_PRUYE|nr:MADS-box transcription factor 29-like [Prunus yedoensis var. nudiflora]
MPRICRGRQKLQMVKMENETNLQVTFSKRRAGLFKKASELSTLCGTELGLIVFSPGKKAFCFGHPSIEEVLDKYEGRPSRQPLNHDMQQIVEACSHATLNELNAELTQVMERIERERKRGEELTQLLKASQAQCGLEGPVEELDLDKMEILRAFLMELRSKVADQAKQKLAAAKTANPPHNPNVYVGSFSSSVAAQSANPAHNNFFVGSSSSSAAAGPSGLHGLVNPEINNVGFNLNGNDFVMQAPDQPNNFGFNFNGAEPVLQAPDQPNNLGFNFNGAERFAGS